MKPWDIYTWNFPKIGPHPAVILSTEERARHKPLVNVLLCSTQRAGGPLPSASFAYWAWRESRRLLTA